MPFCSNCGNFSIQLDSRNHCQACSDAYFKGILKEKDVNGTKIKIEKKLRYKMLNYINDVELQPVVIGSDISNAPIDIQRQNNIAQNHIEPTNRKSTIALVLSFLGFILLFYPSLGIFGLGFEIIGLTLAINSRRTEPPNWRRKIAFVVSTIYFILIIIGIIIIFMDPDIIAETLKDLEAQGYDI